MPPKAPPSPPQALIPATPGAAVLSKAQLAFNRLVSKIERLKLELAQWQALDLRYRQRIGAEAQPLFQLLHTRQRELALLIDSLLSPATPAADVRKLPRGQRNKLIGLVLHLCEELLSQGADDEMEAVFDRYSDVSRADIQEAEMEAAAAFMSTVFGVEVDKDGGAETPEELMRKAAEKWQAKAKEEGERKAAKRAERAARKAAPEGLGARAPGAREQVAQEISQSVRDIYRKLASALHPDREPDATQRQRKTELMQRVNQAYDARDLLGLLSLQLEIEQIDPGHLGEVPPERLAHYNQVLREQAAELEAELRSVIQPFQDMHGATRNPWDEPRRVTPAQVDAAVDAELAQLKRSIAQVESDLMDFGDPDKLRDRLKTLNLKGAEPDFLEGLMAADAAYQNEQGPKKGRGSRKKPKPGWGWG